MRSVSPDCCTLPSTRLATPSAAPILRISVLVPLNENDDVRAATLSSGTWARRLSSVSVMPSEKYSLALSDDMLTKGSTAVDAAPSDAAAPDETDASPARPDTATRQRM